MAFTMPACKRAVSVIALLSVLLAACSERNSNHGFELLGLETRISDQLLKLELTQKIRLSPEAHTALENGVPLYLEVRAELETGDGLISSFQRFEIRYMPLSNHYQLSSDQPAFRRTYPRLRHALADLSVVELILPLAGVTAGTYEIQARSWLEKRKLPAPMRLPAWFSPNWQHDSGWQSWPVTIPVLT
jgi:hypothetical protein